MQCAYSMRHSEGDQVSCVGVPAKMFFSLCLYLWESVFSDDSGRRRDGMRWIGYGGFVCFACICFGCVFVVGLSLLVCLQKCSLIMFFFLCLCVSESVCACARQGKARQSKAKQSNKDTSKGSKGTHDG